MSFGDEQDQLLSRIVALKAEIEESYRNQEPYDHRIEQGFDEVNDLLEAFEVLEDGFAKEEPESPRECAYDFGAAMQEIMEKISCRL